MKCALHARGIESDAQPQLVLIGDLAERDRALFAGAAAQPRRRKVRTISG